MATGVARVPVGSRAGPSCKLSLTPARLTYSRAHSIISDQIRRGCTPSWCWTALMALCTAAPLAWES
jgi:hypothetical protein